MGNFLNTLLKQSENPILRQLSKTLAEQAYQIKHGNITPYVKRLLKDKNQHEALNFVYNKYIPMAAKQQLTVGDIVYSTNPMYGNLATVAQHGFRKFEQLVNPNLVRKGDRAVAWAGRHSTRWPGLFIKENKTPYFYFASNPRMAGAYSGTWALNEPEKISKSLQKLEKIYKDRYGGDFWNMIKKDEYIQSLPQADQKIINNTIEEIKQIYQLAKVKQGVSKRTSYLLPTLPNDAGFFKKKGVYKKDIEGYSGEELHQMLDDAYMNLYSMIGPRIEQYGGVMMKDFKTAGAHDKVLRFNLEGADWENIPQLTTYDRNMKPIGKLYTRESGKIGEIEKAAQEDGVHTLIMENGNNPFNGDTFMIFKSAQRTLGLKKGGKVKWSPKQHSTPVTYLHPTFKKDKIRKGQSGLDFKPETFAGGMAKHLGASDETAAKADIASSVASFIPGANIVTSSLDLGRDANRAVHGEGSWKDVAMDAAFLIPGVKAISKFNLAKNSGKIMSFLHKHAPQVNKVIGKYNKAATATRVAGKTADAVSDMTPAANLLKKGYVPGLNPNGIFKPQLIPNLK